MSVFASRNTNVHESFSSRFAGPDGTSASLGSGQHSLVDQEAASKGDKGKSGFTDLKHRSTQGDSAFIAFHLKYAQSGRGGSGMFEDLELIQSGKGGSGLFDNLAFMQSGRGGWGLFDGLKSIKRGNQVAHSGNSLLLNMCWKQDVLTGALANAENERTRQLSGDLFGLSTDAMTDYSIPIGLDVPLDGTWLSRSFEMTGPSQRGPT